MTAKTRWRGGNGGEERRQREACCPRHGEAAGGTDIPMIGRGEGGRRGECDNQPLPMKLEGREGQWPRHEGRAT